MGSLDVIAAKKQFLQLVDAVSSRHLPSFAIWLDSKLAEYKVNGFIVADNSEAEKRNYPEWISKSLRENLSFCLPQVVPAEETESVNPTSDTERNTAMDFAVASFRDETNPVVSGDANRTEVTETTQSTDTDYQDGDQSIIKIEIHSDDEDSEVKTITSGSAEHVRNLEETNELSVNQTSLLPENFISHHEEQHESQMSQSLQPERLSISSVAVISQSSDQPSYPAAPTFSIHETQQSSSSSVTMHSQAPHSDSLQPLDSVLHQDASGQSHLFYTSYKKPTKSLECSICKKKFQYPSQLTKHKFFHSGVKPFKCSCCPYVTNDRSNLKRHQHAQHKGRV